MKKLITNYTFTAASNTIKLNDYSSVSLEGLLLITNVTDNVILYNFASNTYKASITGNIVTLTYNTSGMSDSDNLQIWYDDANYVQDMDLTTALRQLAIAMANPPWGDKSSNRLRETAIIESGTVTTVTTCTTVTGLTNIDGYQGKTVPINLSNSAWAQVVRSVIS